MTVNGEPRILSVDEVLSQLWRLLVPLALVTIGLHLILWGVPQASPGQWVRGALWMLGAYLLAIPVHELLHVLPMLASGIRVSELRAGVRWRDGVVYVHGGRPVTVRAYRVILATPGVILGILPAIYGLVDGSAFATTFGFLMLASAVGDWAVLRLIRDLPPGARVMDHPSAVGCVVVPAGTHGE